MSALQDGAEAPVSTGSARAHASWFTAQQTLPRHPTIKAFDKDLREALGELIPQIQNHAAQRPTDDVQGKVALAGVDEARRRLGLPERSGLQGEYERVKRLAMSVIALCDHLDALTGIHMCLLCDKELEADEIRIPYDRIVRAGSTAKPGHVHAACAKAARQSRGLNA
ncbi:DUF6415 family natural product biosynthesis protein [Streptomyces sp. bgisy027]|uniref:DUF6415 family natural product biosynthesis protein n=1 Tax=Streptomyces sp. bgisy027 TaxID=3413770 RepID=UPI003D71B717